MENIISTVDPLKKERNESKWANVKIYVGLIVTANVGEIEDNKREVISRNMGGPGYSREY